MRIIVYKKFDEKLYMDWLYLWKRSTFANYANSPQWFKASLETFNYTKYTLITIYEQDMLVGIVPLVKVKVYGISLYTAAPLTYIYGVPFLADLHNQQLLTLLLNKITSLGPVFLANIPEFFVEKLQKKERNIRIVKQAINYYLPLVLDDTGDVQVKNKKKFLHKIKRTAEKFTFKSFDGNSSKGIQTVFSIDSQSRKHSRGYNAFSTKDAKKFYELLAKYFKSHVRINILYFNEMPIAYEIGFAVGQTYYGNQIAFVDEYRQYSPGKLIVVKLLDYLATKGFKKIDFGSGDNGVKRMLTEDSQQLYQVMLSNNFFIKRYIIGMFHLRNYIFDQLTHHETIYKTYRRIKQIIIH